MGHILSSGTNPLRIAQQMRDDLYKRAESFSRKYQPSFHQIDIRTKQQVQKSSAKQVADMIDNRYITSLQATLIFIERTINVGVKNNYVLDQLFQEAVAEAILCDQQRKTDNYKKNCWRPGLNPQQCYPPFYGVPASIKQTTVMKGRQIHLGFVSKINKLSDKDGLFMILVRKMGFIPFVRTNVPQGCKTLETNNNIFGYSKNPWSKNRTCGGSSGGQSGIVSSNCSPIGFGSDIGGSLRAPAAFTGLTTLKPYNRYSRFGHSYNGKFTGGIPLKAEHGPIGKTVQDIMIVHNFLYNPENYQDIPLQDRDPFMKYTPLDMNIVRQKKKYRIGLVKRLKYAKCSKANQRALQQASEILKKEGHQIIEVNFENFEKVYFFLVNIFTFDQKLHLFSEFKGKEPLTAEFKMLSLVGKIPWLIRRIIMWFIRKRQPRLYQMLKASRPLSGTDAFQKIYDIEKIISPQIYRTFALNKLDAVLMAPFVAPAPKHGEIGKLQYFFSFSTSWNVLSYPAGVVPMTVVRADEEDFNDQFNDFYTKNVRETLKGSRGLPIGVQLVSTPYNQQKILNLMQSLQNNANFREKYQIPEQ